MAITLGTWREARRIDVSGGFTPDPDWVATNDVAAATAAGRELLHPPAGTLHRVFSMELRSANDALLYDASATATIELLTHAGESRELKKLIPPTSSIALNGQSVHTDTLPVYKSLVTVRVTAFSTAISPAYLVIKITLG